MGNTESMSESQNEFYYQHPPANYDGSSVSNSYQQPSYDGSLDNDQPSSYAAVNTRHRRDLQPTYIADNFSSLEQVLADNLERIISS